jgi:hypothetical protein
MDGSSPGDIDTGWNLVSKKPRKDITLEQTQQATDLTSKSSTIVSCSMDLDTVSIPQIAPLPTEHDYAKVNGVNINNSTNSNLPMAETGNLYGKSDSAPFLVYIESLPESKVTSMHPTVLGKKLFDSNVNGIVEVKRSNRNRVVCSFESAGSANMFVNSSFSRDNNVRVYVPSFQLERIGLLRNVDPSLSENDIYENLQTSNNVTIISVKRMSKIVTLDDGQRTSKPLSLVTVKFKGKQLPEFVFLFYTRCPVEPYVSNPIICFKCVRYGHTSRNCKSSARCPNGCPTYHNHKDCPQAQTPVCIFCKGPHSSIDKSCPQWDIQKQIKETMAYRNIPYSEAKLFLFPKSTKLPVSFSKVLDINNDKSFPELSQEPSNKLRDSIPIPAQSRLARKNVPINNKVHKNVTMSRFTKRPNPVTPEYTNKYFSQFQHQGNTSKPVISSRAREPTDSSQSDNVSTLVLNSLSLYKDSKISVEHLLSKLQPVLNIDLNQFLSSIPAPNVSSDDSF